MERRANLSQKELEALVAKLVAALNEESDTKIERKVVVHGPNTVEAVSGDK